jgi:surfeit locus 1 family protein
MLVLSVLAIAAFMLTLSLGNWQTRRAADKLALEAHWDAAERATPRDATFATLPAADQLPQQLRLRGEFIHRFTVWLDNRQLDARPGFWVVTPLALDSGGVVLINRGWAPRDPTDRARLPQIVEPAGTVVIEGLAMAQVPRLLELGDGGNAGALPGIWQNLDSARFAQASGIEVAPLVIQQRNELNDGLKRQWVRPASGVDKHRGYAFQWYGLSTLIVVLSIALGLRAWRASRKESAGSLS